MVTVAVQIKRAANVLAARAAKEGKPQPGPGTDSSIYLMSPECELIVIYEDKVAADEARRTCTPCYMRIHPAANSPSC